MRILLLIPLIFSFLFGSESAVDRAVDLYQQEKYAESLKEWQAAMQEHEGEKQNIRYNLAQTYYRLDTIPEALSYFSQATKGMDDNTSSVAYNNQGAIQALHPLPKDGQQGAASPTPAIPGMPQGQQGGVSMEQLQTALELFKSSLRKDHDNETARFNYELVKKMLQQRQEQQQQENDKNEQQQEQEQQEKEEQENQNKQDQQDQPKKGEENNQQQNDQQQSQDPNDKEGKEGEMSKQQAQVLLEALEENEKKFIQQLRMRNKKRSNRSNTSRW